jgi:hypothetical protein
VITVDDDDIFLQQLMFTDEAMFHMNGRVNRNNVCIWGQKLPYEMYGHVQDFLNVNVWCGIVHGAENTTWQTFTWICYSCFFFHKLLVMNKYKEVKFCFNKMVLHPTSGMRCKVPLTSDFIIRGLEEGRPVLWST